MNKVEYYKKIDNEIENILKDRVFDNYKKQIYAWKMGARFNRSYKENFVWQRLLFLSNSAASLLCVDLNNKNAIAAMKECGELYEYLSKVSEEYDKDFCTILSAICYDISGYQANAYCMMKKIKTYSLKGECNEVKSENIILFQFQQLLLKKLPLAINNLNSEKNENPGVVIVKEGIRNFLNNALFGEQNSFKEDIDNAYKYYLERKNVHMSQLFLLLKVRIMKYSEKSVWANLEDKRESLVWQKYIKLLTLNIYEKNKIKEIKNRVSKFEFWISQLQAIKAGVLTTNDSYVIQMPTSAGKTFIAELTIIDTLIKNPNKKCIYIAPYRALSNEIEFELSKNLSKIGFNVSSISGSYEVDDFQNILLHEADVLVATPEKIDFLMRMNPDFFKDIALLVVDEGHIIGNFDERSSLLEFLIIKFKLRSEKLKTLFISAVINKDDQKEISKWINGDQDKTVTTSNYINNQDWQPTRKILGKFMWTRGSGTIYYPDVQTGDNSKSGYTTAFLPGFVTMVTHEKRKYPSEQKDKNGRVVGYKKSETAASLAYQLSKRGNCLIFSSQPSWVDSIAKSFIKLIELYDKKKIKISSHFLQDENRESYQVSVKWYGEESIISKSLKLGVGLHYGPMAEDVRLAIENDFRNGKLKILISTNTIGQGLNFPIKNIVIHSLEINPDHDHYKAVSVRDFWNIFGRAGRAQKETQGELIFIINTQRDNQLFNKYTNKDNLESVKSNFFQVLAALLKKRISSEKFINIVSMFSEPFLFDMLFEEIYENEEKIITAIFDHSLFNVQINKIEDKQILFKGFINVVKNIKQKVKNNEDLLLYSKTGFCLESNEQLVKYIDDNKKVIKQAVESEDGAMVLELIIDIFKRNVLKEMRIDKTPEFYSLDSSKIINFLISWMRGVEIDKLRLLWIEMTDGRLINKFEKFISDALYYKFPWGATAFLLIVSNKLKLDYDNLPEEIKNIPAYIKYGLNSKYACFAKTLGIKSREVAFILASEYQGPSLQDFLLMLSRTNREEIEHFEISDFDKDNIMEVAVKINVNNFKNTIPRNFKYQIKGTFFEKSRCELSRTVEKGDNLMFEREFNNPNDPFAIKVLSDKGQLGYIPRDYSKIISTETDLNDKNYKIIVLDIKDNGQFREINVEMLEI